MHQKEKIGIWYRGLILQEIAKMEFLLNEYIAMFFCGNDVDKTSFMHVLILGDERFTLMNKAQIFKIIGPENDKEWFKKYTSLRVPEKKKPPYDIALDLIWVVEERNIFAHRVLDNDMYNEYFPKDETNFIRFLKFKNEVGVIDYTEKKLSLVVNTIKAIREHLYLITIPENTTAPSA